MFAAEGLAAKCGAKKRNLGIVLIHISGRADTIAPQSGVVRREDTATISHSVCEEKEIQIGRIKVTGVRKCLVMDEVEQRQFTSRRRHTHV